jgi:hypothetical protein
MSRGQSVVMYHAPWIDIPHVEFPIRRGLYSGSAQMVPVFPEFFQLQILGRLVADSCGYFRPLEGPSGCGFGVAQLRIVEHSRGHLLFIQDVIGGASSPSFFNQPHFLKLGHIFPDGLLGDF